MINISEHSLREATLIQAVINAIPAPVFFKGVNGLYIGCNDAFAAFVGRAREEVVGKGVFELWDEELARIYFEADRELLEKGGQQIYETQVTYADGSVHDVMFHKSVFFVEEDGSNGIVGVVLDITERKNAERKLEQLARTDMLTGLGNRLTFFETLERTCKHADRYGSGFTVLALDLDGFKEVNDSYGHPVGDALLVEIAKRLRASVRETDFVFRIGGDEFFIVLENVTQRGAVAVIAQNIIDNVAVPYQLAGQDIGIGASIGIASYDVDAYTVEAQALVHQADAALYQAKNNGKGRFAFAKVKCVD